jgi:phage baseplate assembly protein V
MIDRANGDRADAAGGPAGGPVFRVALVKAIDAANARVRVVFPDRDQMQSWWLPVIFAKTQNDKLYWMPDVGEQVVCVMDEHDEDGAILGSIYSSADRPPVSSADKVHWSSKDGAVFEYDRAAHAFVVSLPAGGTVSISANGATIAIDAAGDVSIAASGQITLAGGGPAIARVGDTTVCPAGSGQIVSGSARVTSG